jgi:hypothetical protein
VNVLIDTAGVCLVIAELRLRRQGRILFPAVDDSSAAVRSRNPTAIW